MMDIKGFGLQIVGVAESVEKPKGAKAIKSEASSDRDANGRREDSGDKKKEELTEEHIKKAIFYLENHKGIKNNNFLVKRKTVNGKVLLFIEDYLGKIVRRVPEEQIIALAKTEESPEANGQIFHRTA